MASKLDEIAETICCPGGCRRRTGGCTAYQVKDVARKVLLRMREPTEEMRLAGKRAWMLRNLQDPNSEPIRDFYQAMIDDILSEGK